MTALKTTCLRLLAIAALIALPLAAWAGQPFDAAAFQQAQESGKSILVHVQAPWCPVCAKQRPILQRIEAATPALTAFDVDFDHDQAALKQFNVQHQSTIIVFKGKAEIGRSTGDSDAASIQSLVAKGM
jgi:thiol-disulfide isomerase/thioredoxin